MDIIKQNKRKFIFLIFTITLALIVIIFSFSPVKFLFKPRASQIASNRWNMTELLGGKANVTEVEKIQKKEEEQYLLRKKTEDEVIQKAKDKKSDSGREELAQAAGASGGGGAVPAIGNRTLPTTSGINVDTFTGSSNISYPISIPQTRGAYKLGFSLNYSSRAIDELRLNVRGKQDFENPADCGGNCWEQRNAVSGGSIGSGWSLTGLDRIDMDPDSRNRFIMSLGQIRAEIVYDNETQKYK